MFYLKTARVAVYVNLYGYNEKTNNNLENNTKFSIKFWSS